jgi:hypothetical protein
LSPLSDPPTPLTGFPGYRLSPDRPLIRIHRHDRGPWWFSHDKTGRFDLTAPRGTCYLAEEPIGAFVEVFRHSAFVQDSDVARRRISTLYVERPVVLADCTTRRARAFGVTAAIHSSEDYARTQRWAEAFADAGFDGIRYRLSHDPAQRAIGVALFGPAGSAAWPVAATAPIDDALIAAVQRRFGIRVLPTP